MRCAAIDLGKVRVGLAVSDELGLLAHARPFLDGTNPGRVVDALAAFADEEGVDLFVVGLPRTLEGREGAAARRARVFARNLQIIDCHSLSKSTTSEYINGFKYCLRKPNIIIQ